MKQFKQRKSPLQGTSFSSTNQSPMGKTPTLLLLLFLVSVLLCFLSSVSCFNDILLSPGTIRKGQFLVSSNNKYTLGFFSPFNSNKTYLGIWFTVDPSKTVVWVANRDAPLFNDFGFLGIDQNNTLFLSNGGEKIWKAGERESSSVALQLLDNGNLVLRSSRGEYIWQSFDHPTNTLLPEMKLGMNRRTGRVFNLTSWAEEDDPAQGPYTYSLDIADIAQPLLRENSTVIFRSGPWNGNGWSGNRRMNTFKGYTFTLRETLDEVFYQYNVTQSWTLARLVVDSSGGMRRFEWDDNTKTWFKLWSTVDSNCDNYAYCRPNGVCGVDSVPCKCFPGYRPRNKEDWDAQNWSGGCEKISLNNCTAGDKFQPVDNVKLPDTFNATRNDGLNKEECEKLCLKNCGCTAYAQAFRNGSRCIIWIGDLIDSATSPAGGQTLFVRVAPNEYVVPPSQEEKSHNSVKGRIIIITLGAALALFTLILCTYLIWWKRSGKNKIGTAKCSGVQVFKDLAEDDNELAFFPMGVVLTATNNFARSNWIGRGGFGDVYKGVLEDGKPLAVKRLSSYSGEGVDGFATEVRTIARLQHRNLVRLLGCCIEGEERLLVYEYMANGSLDLFIFGERWKRLLLGWERRLNILLGIARGLLYLHHDSRLRVIHRDLKAANILLDEEMNPKISDFGTARIFEREQMEDDTLKIVGTIGYMSPEYHMTGKYSEKSDIFSFGVLVLEVLCGKKNQPDSLQNLHMHLLANAWTLWSANECSVILDSALDPPTDLSDVKRFINVALLCVQECPENRPTMLQVVFMLANATAEILHPEVPGFSHPSQLGEAFRWFAGGRRKSADFTVTCIEGR